MQEFTDDPHLINVAVSRAKKQFTLVVSAEDQPDSNIRDLIDYIEYYQGESKQSEISSIFDLLYEDYTKDLLDFYKTHKKGSRQHMWDMLKDSILSSIGLPLLRLSTAGSQEMEKIGQALSRD